MSQKESTKAALDAIFLGIEILQKTYEGKRMFTIDGRLVGDIGEVIAERDYMLELDQTSKAKHDGTTPDGTRVQIKATFKDSLTYKGKEGLYLGFKLHKDGSYEEIYNGPASVISERFKDRKNIDKSLLSFPIKDLKALQTNVPDGSTVKRRG